MHRFLVSLFRFAERRHVLACWIILWLTVGTAILWLLPAFAQAPASAPPPTAAPVPKVVQLDESQGYAVPFNYDPPLLPFPVIPVSINNSRSMPFILDTGTQSSVFLFPSTVNALHLALDKTMPPQSDRGLSRQLTEDIVNVDLITVEAGKVNFLSQAWVGPFPVFENLTTPRIAGVIGMGTFDKFTVRFDFDAKMVTFFVAPHPPLQLPAPAITLPMQKPITGYLRAYATLPGGKPIPFMLDTGSTSSILPALGSLKEVRLAEGGASSYNASGLHTVEQVLLPSLTLNGLSLPLVDFTIDPGVGQAILGMDVLSCFRVTIDARNGFLTLEPRRNAACKLLGMTDLLLEEHAGQVFISQIARLPLQTELAVGDRLLSIDGKETKGLALIETYLLLNGYGGTKATLVVEKADNTRKTLVWTRRTHFPEVVTGAWGLTLLHKSRQVPRIIGVAPASEAERLGLQVGDEIVAVNGRPTRDMTANELQDLLATDTNNHADLDTLMVQRKGEKPREINLKTHNMPSKL